MRSTWASASDLSQDIPDEPFDIRAARLEYAGETVIATGGVTGRFENAAVRADQMSGSTQTGDLHLEGNVHFERGNVLWQGVELDYNYLAETGSFGPSTLQFDPVLISVDHVERVSTNEYLLKGAAFTTCPKEAPHFHVRVKEARLISEKYLKAKGVTVYAGSIPVLYVPYWHQKLSKGILSFNVGYGSEWGAYFRLNASVPWTKQFESNTGLHLYGRRGTGLEQGAVWEYPNSKGFFSAFYLRDQDPYRKFSDAASRELIHKDRYRVKLKHRHRFSDVHYINTRWNFLSDPNVVEEFFKPEHRQSEQQENYASWVYGNSYIASEVFAALQPDKFYTGVDRLDYSLDVYRTRLAGTPLYFHSENKISSLKRISGKADRTVFTLPEYQSERIDTLHVLSLPQYWGGFLNLVPRVSYRATYYSDSVTGGETLRKIPGVGLEASFHAVKILSEREHWYGKGLRHRIEPYIDYTFADSSTETNRLLQFDSVDALQDENKMKIGLHNILQTRRKNRISRFIDLDMYTRLLFKDRSKTDSHFDSLFLEARMPLTQRTTVSLEGEVDWNAGGVSFFHTRFNYDHDEWILGLEHFLQKKETSLWIPRFNLFPKRRRSLEGYARYNDRDNNFEEIALIGYINRCCMRYGLGYHFYEENEHRLLFSIGLSAFPSARIKSSF